MMLLGVIMAVVLLGFAYVLGKMHERDDQANRDRHRH